MDCTFYISEYFKGGGKRKREDSAHPTAGKPPTKKKTPSKPSLFPGYELGRSVTAKHESATVVYYGNKIGDLKQLIFKIFLEFEGVKTFVPDEPTVLNAKENNLQDVTKLKYEAHMYALISTIPELRRNVVKYVDFLALENDKRNDAKLVSAELIKTIKLSLAFNFDYRILATVTEYENAPTLYEYLRNCNAKAQKYYSEAKTYDPVVAILFQLLWGIQTLQAHNIQHNDMHFGNVLISDTWPDDDREYTVLVSENPFTSAKPVTFTLPHDSPRVVFFDWDLSDRNPVNGAESNNYLADFELCKKYGVCPGLNERREIYKGVYDLLRYKDHYPHAFSKNVLTFLRSIVSKPEKITEINGNPCNLVTYTNRETNQIMQRCEPFGPDEPKSIKSTQTLLVDPLFHIFPPFNDF